MKLVDCYKVYWDNGANACGEFDTRFDTPQGAKDFGDDWAIEMNAIDPPTEDCEEGYTFEIIEVYLDGSYEIFSKDRLEKID